MSTNIGTIDRIARVVLGLVLLGLALFGGHWWGWIGIVPLATAVVGFCPAYRLVGRSTCPIAPRQS